MSLKDEIIDLVAKEAMLDPAEVASADFYSRPLPIDSMLAIELVMALQKRFGIKFAEEDFVQLVNIDSAVAVITRLIEAKAGAAPAEEPGTL